MLDTQEKLGLRMGAFYRDKYVKVDGEWKIEYTGYETVFREVWNREDIKSLALKGAMQFKSAGK